MSAQDLEQRARALLAAEYEAAGESWAIWGILNSPHEQLINSLRLAIRAIAAALRQQPVHVVDDAAACRLDDYLSGEFSIRIGKQAARDALTAAIARAQGVKS